MHSPGWKTHMFHDDSIGWTIIFHQSASAACFLITAYIMGCALAKIPHLALRVAFTSPTLSNPTVMSLLSSFHKLINMRL